MKNLTIDSRLPLISIIVPAYNAEKTIGSTLDSLANQTFSNLEIIVIDDGSVDRTSEVVEKKSIMDSRFYLIKKGNGGAGDARNVGLKMASGDYVTFVDSDDLLDQSAIQVMVATAISRNVDVVVGKHAVFTDNALEPDLSAKTEYDELATDVAASAAIELILYKKEHEGVCGNLYRKDLFQGIVFPLVRVYEDACFNLLALSKAETCALLHEPFYWYRQRGESLTHTYSSDFSQELLSSYQAVLADVSERSNISLSAINHSLFCYASNLLWRIDPKFECDELWRTIKNKRASIFFDGRASAKYKAAAMCSLLGRRGYKVIGERALHIQKAEQ